MKTYKRAERVKHLLQQEISLIIQNDLKDPRVQMVTVTNVRLSPDLREGRVLVTSLSNDPAERDAILLGLKRATGYIRGELGRRLEIKFIPQLEFVFDDSYEKQERILNLLEQIHEETSSAEASSAETSREEQQ
jgi:ribosome-binding factor A